MSTERNLSLIDRGRASDALLSVFNDFIESRKKTELDKLLGHFRGGRNDLLAQQTAAYCAILDLQSELLKAVKSGGRAAKEIYESGSD